MILTATELRHIVFETSVVYANYVRTRSVQEAELIRFQVLHNMLHKLQIDHLCGDFQ